jgi:ribosomal protein S18 acetylase RimI-like enzyme
MLEMMYTDNSHTFKEIVRHFKWQYPIRILTIEDEKELQGFLIHLDDFFYLCEGIKGSAQDILTQGPKKLDVRSDKCVLGLYEASQLFGLVELVRNYPKDNVWTIGYFLIHPAWRGSGVGSSLIETFVDFAALQGVKKVRCITQEQNPKALTFWKRHGFEVESVMRQHLGNLTNQVYCLERVLID